jgi:hypothetical protein
LEPPAIQRTHGLEGQVTLAPRRIGEEGEQRLVVEAVRQHGIRTRDLTSRQVLSGEASQIATQVATQVAT